MATRTWDFRDDQLRKYVVTFEHNRWSGWQTLTLNGKQLVHLRRRWQGNGEHSFEFDGHTGSVRIHSSGASYSYSLHVDGQHVAEQGTTLAAPGTTPNEEAMRQQIQREMGIRRRIGNGAGWFYWISGTSLVNAIAYNAGIDLGFPIAAISGFLLSGFAIALGVPIVGWVGHLGVAGTFWYIARRAGAGSHRAFVVGAVLYGLDTLVVVTIADSWLFAVFHALALYGIFGGWRATKDLARVPSASAA